MKTKIKHNLLYILLLLFIGAGIFIFIFAKKPVPKSKELINHLSKQAINSSLIYSNISLDTIQAFNLTTYSLKANHGIKATDESYKSYTEGFLARDTYDQLLGTVNTYREKKGLSPITYFYQYNQDEHYAFISLSEGLDTLYIIDLKTFEISTPSFSAAEAKAKQYVYHIIQGQKFYYILTAAPNSYKAHLYTLDIAHNFSLTPIRSYTTSPVAATSNQYGLDSQGRAYFTSEQGIDVVSKESITKLPLSFTPQSLLISQDRLYSLGLNDDTLYYQSYDASLKKLADGELPLPSPQVTLVDSFVKEDWLYTLTFDASHPIYRNYMTVYDLKTKRIIYCLALYDYENMAALELHEP